MALNFELLGDIRDSELRGQLNFGSPADYTPTILKKLIPVFQMDLAGTRPSIILEPSRQLRAHLASGALNLAIVAKEPEDSDGIPLWSEEIAWFGNAVTQDDSARVGLLSTDCVLRDRSLSDLGSLERNHVVVMESTTVSSLQEAVNAGFCQAFLPVSIAKGLERSTSIADKGSMVLTFTLLIGTTFDRRVAERIADKFKRALES